MSTSSFPPGPVSDRERVERWLTAALAEMSFDDFACTTEVQFAQEAWEHVGIPGQAQPELVVETVRKTVRKELSA
jgi:hypothetical protein